MFDMIEASKTNGSQPVFAASFWPATRRAPANITIDLIQDGRRRLVSAHPCENKREARKFAASMNATPWNF